MPKKYLIGKFTTNISTPHIQAVNGALLPAVTKYIKFYEPTILNPLHLTCIVWATYSSIDHAYILEDDMSQILKLCLWVPIKWNHIVLWNSSETGTFASVSISVLLCSTVALSNTYSCVLIFLLKASQFLECNFEPLISYDIWRV